MEHEHSPDAIRRRLESGPTHNYLRDWIYGGIDGAVTTLAVVTGVAGAQLSKQRVVELVTSDRDRWVQTMLTDEYGLPPAIRSPWIAALNTFMAFAICQH